MVPNVDRNTLQPSDITKATRSIGLSLFCCVDGQIPPIVIGYQLLVNVGRLIALAFTVAMFVCLFQLLQLVVGGDLPCSKEEAASLAGIQLRIEESWGRPLPGGTSSTTQHPPVPVSPDDPSTLRPISEDKVSRRDIQQKPIITQFLQFMQPTVFFALFTP